MGVGLRLNKRWSTNAAMVAMAKSPTKDRLCFLLLASIAVRIFSPCSDRLRYFLLCESLLERLWDGTQHSHHKLQKICFWLHCMVSAAKWLQGVDTHGMTWTCRQPGEVRRKFSISFLGYGFHSYRAFAPAGPVRTSCWVRKIQTKRLTCEERSGTDTARCRVIDQSRGLLFALPLLKIRPNSMDTM